MKSESNFLPLPAVFRNPSLSSLFINPCATVISVPSLLANTGARTRVNPRQAVSALLHKHVAFK